MSGFRRNILSTTRFKLLIPSTRNSANEVLATQILKRLGFISPVTFAVKTEVNGISSPMLFQEVSSKELVEKIFDVKVHYLRVMKSYYGLTPASITLP